MKKKIVFNKLGHSSKYTKRDLCKSPDLKVNIKKLKSKH